MDFIKLIGGLILLVLSGDYLVKGGVSIATRLKISPLVIGMTIVAFGTSAPELLVSLQAALKGAPEIAVGNVVGSNIANIALILGLTAAISPLAVTKNSIRVDWPVMMLATVAFGLAASNGIIEHWEGGLGILSLIVFVVAQIYYSRKNHIEEGEVEENPDSILVSSLFIIGSCAGLALGSRFLIEGASNIASSFGVSERIIGVTVVAFGTSLPELAASITAAVKRQADIAIGNIIGSNLFNILCVIGISSGLKTISLNWSAFRTDFIWMTAISFALIILIIPFKKVISQKGTSVKEKIKMLTESGKLGRIGGTLLVISYIYYIYLLF